MNKSLLKGIGAVVIAAAIFAGGYTAGQRVREDNIISALPRKTLDMTEPPQTLTPSPQPTAGNTETQRHEKKHYRKELQNSSSGRLERGWKSKY